MKRARDSLLASSREITRPPKGRASMHEEDGSLRILEWSGFDRQDLLLSYRERFPDSKIEYVRIANSDELTERTRKGLRFDLAHPEIGYLIDLIDLGLLREFDLSLIPNVRYIDESILARGRMNGRQYHIPLDWGLAVPLCNPDRVDSSTPSYRLLFDKRYGGHISWFDSPWMLIIAAYVLGIENPWDMLDAELDDVVVYLREMRVLVHSMWSSRQEMERSFLAGDIWVAYAWNSSYMAVAQAGAPALFVTQPEEGAIVWMEGFVLGAASSNPFHAHAYVDAWASPTAAAELTRLFGLGHWSRQQDPGVALNPVLARGLSLTDATAFDEPNHVERYVPRRATYRAAWLDVRSR